MKRLREAVLAVSLAAGALVCLCTGGALLSARADGTVEYNYSKDGVTVTCGENTLTAITDPYTNTDVSSGGRLTGNRWNKNAVAATQTVLYSAYWWRTTSERTGDYTEYRVERDGERYKIAAISDAETPAGSMYIPAGGFVLSVPAAEKALGAVGDYVILGGTQITLPTMAVESDKGDRVAVDALNAVRSKPMVVYYDYQTGDKTGTNAYGTELVATYDEESNAFVVTAFRAFGEGDASGITIPDNSFALSAYGEGFRGILEAGKRFSMGDKLSLVGFDYVRFGNTVTGNFNFIDPTLESNPKGWDPATNGEFPALRGENQLNVYRDGWSYKGAAGTGANVYGYEVAVNNEGVVVERNVNVSAIPEGGFVLSGHGTGRDFLRAEVPLGATVVLNEANKTFSVTTTLNSFYTNVKLALDAAVESAETRMKQLYDVNTALLGDLLTRADAGLAELLTVKEGIEAGEAEWDGARRTRELMSFNRLQLEVSGLADAILSASLESKPVAGRAVWHRPTELSLNAIRETVQTYKDCGINLIFVETFYHGMTMYKSDLAPYHADFTSGNYGSYPDYLSAFADIAHEAGIEVHAWVEDFYVGINEARGVYASHKDWVLYNNDKSILQRNEGGSYIFLDPANPEVQDFLIDLYNELLEKVPYIGGINLDYIRYPVSNRAEDTGYTEVAMKGFAQFLGKPITASGYDAIAKEFKKLFNSDYNRDADENYTRWVNYRTQIVTDFVERVTREVKGTHAGLILSTAVFPSLTESIDSKKQDWQTWFKNGWIDIATPMAYYDDAADVLLHVKDMILMAGSNCYYYAGLASSFRGLPADVTAEQVDASWLAGANGYVIFCSTQILGHEDVQEVLKSGVNRAPAVLPHVSVKEVLRAYFGRIEERAKALYLPDGSMTQSGLDALKEEFARILALDTATRAGIEEAIDAIEELSYSYNSYAAGYAGRRLSETFNEMLGLMDVKLSRFLIDSGAWDPAQTPARPGSGSSSGSGSGSGSGTLPGGTTEQPEAPKKKGCGCGSVTFGSTALCTVLIGAAALVLVRKKKN